MARLCFFFIWRTLIYFGWLVFSQSPLCKIWLSLIFETCKTFLVLGWLFRYSCSITVHISLSALVHQCAAMFWRWLFVVQLNPCKRKLRNARNHDQRFLNVQYQLATQFGGVVSHPVRRRVFLDVAQGYVSAGHPQQASHVLLQQAAAGGPGASDAVRGGQRAGQKGVGTRRQPTDLSSTHLSSALVRGLPLLPLPAFPATVLPLNWMCGVQWPLQTVGSYSWRCSRTQSYQCRK